MISLEPFVLILSLGSLRESSVLAVWETSQAGEVAKQMMSVSPPACLTECRSTAAERLNRGQGQGFKQGKKSVIP